MSVSEVTSSNITVQWEAVDCIHQNGDITGYSVQYNEVGSESIQNISVTGGSVTISNLTSSTTYNVQVAAVNDAGTGVFSNSTSIMTLGKMDHSIVDRLCNFFSLDI